MIKRKDHSFPNPQSHTSIFTGFIPYYATNLYLYWSLLHHRIIKGTPGLTQSGDFSEATSVPRAGPKKNMKASMDTVETIVVACLKIRWNTFRAMQNRNWYCPRNNDVQVVNYSWLFLLLCEALIKTSTAYNCFIWQWHKLQCEENVTGLTILGLVSHLIWTNKLINLETKLAKKHQRESEGKRTGVISTCFDKPKC